MQILFNIITFLILGLIVTFPIGIRIILRKKKIKYGFAVYMLTCTIFLVILSVGFAWWTYESDKILMSNYGYDFDGDDHAQRFERVAAENIQKVKSMEISMMGIGWPLKAFFGFVIAAPYLLVVYFGIFIFERLLFKR